MNGVTNDFSQSLFDRANEEWELGREDEAFSLMREAAKEGDTHAFNSMGYFFERGIGVQPDLDQALFWYKRAAKAGDKCAYSNIGLLYRDLGNRKRARFWLNKASRQSDGDALLELAKLYLHRRTKSNIGFAIRFLLLAVDAENITPASREEANALISEMGKT